MKVIEGAGERPKRLGVRRRRPGQEHVARSIWVVIRRGGKRRSRRM